MKYSLKKINDQTYPIRKFEAGKALQSKASQLTKGMRRGSQVESNHMAFWP